MQTEFHSSESRGFANHGWLKSYHSFSFASYYNSKKMHFGALRVLNDDYVAGGMGFDTHPHKDMEIITIVLKGALAHKDSMGNSSVINAGDVQVMSAGTGIMHSEYNSNKNEAVELLQIWVIPNKTSVEPRYQQITLDAADRLNTLQQILSPDEKDAGVWIHQNAWFHLTTMDAGKSLNYTLKKEGNGIYVFVIEGEVSVDGKPLKHRDALGLWEVEQIAIEAASKAEVLIIEVPMDI